MLCVYCNSDIENDSFHCDQCGKEIFLCPNCNLPRKGKHCVEDTGKLYSPKQKSISGISTDPTVSTSPSSQNISILKGASQPAISNNTQIPILKISNTNLKIDIEIKDRSIIGRTVGEYVDIFSTFSDISGKHLVFEYQAINGWTVKDTGSDDKGSTYGTKLNKTPSWDNTAKLIPNNPTPLKDNTYLLIADKYEFFVRILPQSLTPTGTKRL